MMSGRRAKLGAFWLSLLKPASREQYVAALTMLHAWLLPLFPDFWTLDEESQDFALAEFVLDSRDGEEGVLRSVALPSRR